MVGSHSETVEQSALPPMYEQETHAEKSDDLSSSLNLELSDFEAENE